MAKEKARLTLRIKRKWLEEIVFGKKRIECRDNTKFYAQRLLETDEDGDLVCRKFDEVYFYCPIGQTGQNLMDVVQYKKTDWNEKINQMEIYLGKVISHNLPTPKVKKK